VQEANLLAATAQCSPGAVMNCACHGRVTLNELVDEINRVLGKKLRPVYKDARKGDIKHSFAAIEMARREIGYVPQVDFKNGLEKTIDWYQKHPAQVS